MLDSYSIATLGVGSNPLLFALDGFALIDEDISIDIYGTVAIFDARLGDSVVIRDE